MNKMLQRALMAYRPLYLHGLLIEGRCRLPGAAAADAGDVPKLRQRTLLVALVHAVSHLRSK